MQNGASTCSTCGRAFTRVLIPAASSRAILQWDQGSDPPSLHVAGLALLRRRIDARVCTCQDARAVECVFRSTGSISSSGERRLSQLGSRGSLLSSTVPGIPTESQSVEHATEHVCGSRDMAHPEEQGRKASFVSRIGRLRRFYFHATDIRAAS